ncbi:MAG: chalcone isomerase family protein [Burkholderiales bacterium]|nr:chalcone isomerase family protein [Burkholderiales bacterium]
MHRRPSVRARARGLTAALLLSAAGFAPSAYGDARKEAPRLPAPVAQAYPDLAPLGAGTMRWFGFHVYDARLWAIGLAPRDDAPYVLALRYARDFEGARIAQSSIEEIERLGRGTPAERARWLAEMRRVFPDVRAGAELAGLHVPGRGARFFHDGRLIGTIDDPEFARAFFAIWLDPRTRAPELRAALVGGDRQ